MKKLHYYVRLCVGSVGLALLFAVNFLYLVAALGLFSFGLAALPASLLGAAGFIHVTTDFSLLPLLLICGGILLLGFGMCLGIAVVCPASAAVLRRFCVKLSRWKERLSDA